MPVPSFQSFDALNAHLEQRCLERMDARLRGHDATIGQRMERDLDALLSLPAVPYDACDKQASRVSSLSLVRYRTNDYSMPVAYGHREVLVRGYTPEYVEDLVAEVKRVYPTVRAHERQKQAAGERAIRREEKGNWLATIITRIGIFLLGIVVTWVGYAMAGPDGTYLLAVGAFLVGIFLVLKGLYHRLRWW